MHIAVGGDGPWWVVNVGMKVVVVVACLSNSANGICCIMWITGVFGCLEISLIFLDMNLGVNGTGL